MVKTFMNLKNQFKLLSSDNKLIIYFSIILLIPFFIFIPINFTWANDPFQKVILAPLGEEPMKLLIAFVFCYVSLKSNNYPRIKHLEFSDIFLYVFVFFSIIAGFSVGLGEGALGNIFLHISSSSIGAILISFTFLKVKNRPWKTGYKLASMFVTISVPMFIHSLSNQFLNISYANQYPSFNYLVVIGRFLVDNNLIKNAFFFDLLVFCIAMILVFIWYVYLSYRKKKIHSLH